MALWARIYGTQRTTRVSSYPRGPAQIDQGNRRHLGRPFQIVRTEHTQWYWNSAARGAGFHPSLTIQREGEDHYDGRFGPRHGHVLVSRSYILQPPAKKKQLTSLLDRGEGANHAIYDVFEFYNRVTAHLFDTDPVTLREALDDYEDILAKRTRPAVMASRRACLDAHDWPRVKVEKSPLFLKRDPWIEFSDKDME